MKMELFKKFNEFHTAMLWSVTEAEAFDWYCKACDVRQEICTGECGMMDCNSCFLTREYNDICREIRKRPKSGSVTYNIAGKPVTITVNGNNNIITVGKEVR